jgi:aspartyl-tRNA(Asn)/glutamyl-tRNA(Gln) amidotransferase subunit C
MSIDKSAVRKIARLARLNVPEDRLEPIANELTSIIDWIEELNEVSTENIEPLASVTGHALPMREDLVTDGNCTDAILANVPEEASGFFVVPKVVE